LSFCEIPKKRNEIQEHLSFKDRKYFRLNVLNPLLEEGLLEPLLPGKPQSSKQKYIVTEKGKKQIDTAHYPPKYPPSTPQVPRKY
jgi:ATP-dependent DNA helicase RecG